jgi:uncharacterized protein YsxB (DUF464 family)
VIRCLIRLDPAGYLEGFESSGHGLQGTPSGARGAGLDLVCAAVTTLLRTASRMLYQHPELDVEGGAPGPGVMHLSVRKVPERLRPWLEGVTDFLLAGLRDIESEHPQGLQITVRRKGTTDHGT